MKCIKCEKEIKEEMAFCPYCGTEVKPETETQKPQCPSCNCEIETNMVFCPSCGYEISDNERKRFNKPEIEDGVFENNKKYCVVITGTKSGPLPLVTLIRKKTGFNLSMSKKLAKNLPLPLFLNLSEKEAKAMVDALAKDGIEAVVEDSSFSPQNPNASSNARPEKLVIQPEATKERKRKLKTATVLSAVAAVLSVIVALCVLLLPLFTSSYYETVDSETVSMEKNISLLVSLINSVKSVFSASNTSSFAFLGWIYLLIKLSITISAIHLIVSSIKLSVEKIENLIKFEEYSARELSKDFSTRSTEELLKLVKISTQGSMLFQVVIDLGLIIFIFGYGTVIWGTIIAIAIMASIAYVVEKIATWIKKKALV